MNSRIGFFKLDWKGSSYKYNIRIYICKISQYLVSNHYGDVPIPCQTFNKRLNFTLDCFKNLKEIDVFRKRPQAICIKIVPGSQFIDMIIIFCRFRARKFWLIYLIFYYLESTNVSYFEHPSVGQREFRITYYPRKLFHNILTAKTVKQKIEYRQINSLH